MIQEVLIILVLILINGFFALSEISIVSAKRVKLQALEKRGSKGAKKARELAEDPTRLLSSVQVGITLIGILTGFFSGGSISDLLVQTLMEAGVSAKLSNTLAIAITVSVITYLSLIIGELVPKKLGLLAPERIATVMALPVYFISQATAPVVWLLTKSTNMLVSLLGISGKRNEDVTEEEVKSLIAQGTTTGTFEAEERSLVEQVFHFSDRAVASVMVPRQSIEWVNDDVSLTEIKDTVYATPHSHLMVCHGDLDDITGILEVKKLLKTPDAQWSPGQLKQTLRKPYYVSGGLNALKCLRKMRDRNEHIALVINEYGSLLGLITSKDIINALLADLSAEQANDDQSIEKTETGWGVAGNYPILELLEDLEIDDEEIRVQNDYHTVGGFFLHQHKGMPHLDDSIVFGKFNFRLVEMEGLKIGRVEIKKVP